MQTGGLCTSDSNEKGVNMVRFRQWWWRMGIAVVLAYGVAVLEYRSEKEMGLAAMVEGGLYSVFANTLDLSSEIAEYISGPLVFGTFPAIFALLVYHFLIGRAHRVAMRSAGASSTKEKTAES